MLSLKSLNLLAANFANAKLVMGNPVAGRVTYLLQKNATRLRDASLLKLGIYIQIATMFTLTQTIEISSSYNYVYCNANY